MAQRKRTPQQQPQSDATRAPADSAAFESVDPRREAIAEAAYYKAEQRGFAPGNDMQDWLDAERELAARETEQ
jgi:hypothetical protein